MHHSYGIRARQPSSVVYPTRVPGPAEGGCAGAPFRYGFRAMHDLGKTLFIVGLVLAVAGAIMWKTGGLGGLGRLPGDIFVPGKNSTFYFPIVTCFVVSAVLTLLAWLFRR